MAPLSISSVPNGSSARPSNATSLKHITGSNEPRTNTTTAASSSSPPSAYPSTVFSTTRTALTLCNVCKRVPPDGTYKTCAPCRMKRNEYKKDRKRRNDFLARLKVSSSKQSSLGTKTVTNAGLPPTSSGTVKKEQLGPVPMKVDSIPATPKPSVSSTKLSSTSSVIGKTKPPITPITQLSTTKHTPPSHSSQSGNTIFVSVVSRDLTSGPEYQSMQFFVNDLAATMLELSETPKEVLPTKIRSFQFYGSFSIVADPDMDHRKRVSRVVQDFRKLKKLGFSVIQTSQGNNISESYKIYPCHCSDASFSSPTPSLKGKERAMDIDQPIPTFTWSSKKKKVDIGDMVVEAPVRNVCGGVVKFVVKGDQSHSILSGQKVTIMVRHPQDAMKNLT